MPRKKEKNEATADSLARIADRVKQRLRRFFDEIETTPPSPLFETQAGSIVLAQVRDLTLRSGKRLRAALLTAGAALFDPKAEESPSVLDAAAAMELCQTYLLIHDDIMDGDTIRRGAPTVHVALGGFTGDPRKGEALGILAGDLASALVQILLSQMPVAESILPRVISIFSAMHLDVVCGQGLDMLGEVSAYEVAVHKTASYTTIGPLTAGAAIAGARDKDIEHLAQIALPLGVAFQFRDDLLGTFGNTKTTGKPSDSDIKEGKRTALIEEARAKADRYQLKRLNEIWGNRDATESEVQTAREIMVMCGARAALSNHIQELTEEFVAGLDRPYYTTSAKAFLTGVAALIAERDA
jgi:geranylgeranyl diphosphate synthase, type I